MLSAEEILSEGEDQRIEDGQEQIPEEVSQLPSVQITRIQEISDTCCEITWQSNMDGAQFEVLQVQPDGHRELLGVTLDKQFQDPAYRKGTWYRIIAHGIDGTSVISSSICTGWIPKPPLTIKASGVDGNAVVRWDYVTGATGYKVYRRSAGSSKWYTLATLNHKYVLARYDTTAAPETYYEYRVSAIRKMDEVLFISQPTQSVDMEVQLGTPVLHGISKVDQSVVLSWKEILGAIGYQVLYRTSPDEDWQEGPKTENCYVQLPEELSSDTAFYSVRAIGSAGFSQQDPTGVSLSTRIGQPAKILLEGDSIAYGKAALGDIQSEMNLGTKIALELGVEVVNQAVSGSMMGGQKRSVLYRAKYGSTQYADYDCIIISGGINDKNHDQGLPIGSVTDTDKDRTFYGYLNAVITLIRKQNPTAPIIFFTPTYVGQHTGDWYTRVGYDTPNSYGYTLADFTQAEKTIASRNRNVYAFDNQKRGIINIENVLSYTWDGLHMTDNGYSRLGLDLAGYIRSKQLYLRKDEDLKNARITLSGKRFIYTGQLIRPEVTVKLHEWILDPSEYTITYKDYVHPGTATVTVTARPGCPGLHGSCTKTFTIVPKQVTKVRTSRTASGTKIRVNWQSRKEATGYEISYAMDRHFTKKVRTITCKQATRQLYDLRKSTDYYIRVRAYTRKNGVDYYGAWSEIQKVKGKK